MQLYPVAVPIQEKLYYGPIYYRVYDSKCFFCATEYQLPSLKQYQYAHHLNAFNKPSLLYDRAFIVYVYL